MSFDNVLESLEPFGDSSHEEVPFYVPEPKPKWLYDFCVDVCGHYKLSPQPHYEMINQVESLIDHRLQDMGRTDKIRKGKFILVPRGCFKTTILCEDLVLAILTKSPNARILITSNNARLAKQRMEAIKYRLEKSEEFQRRYGKGWKPKHREGVWSTNAITVAKRTEIFREPSVVTAAVGVEITGMHFDFVFADDVVDRENTRSKDQRDNVTAYISSLSSLLDPGGVFLGLGTHWHPDDPYIRLRKRDEELVLSGESPFYDWYIRDCYSGPNGLYFPEEYPHEVLERFRLETGGRFAANYLNKPIADEDLVFKPEFLVERDFDYFTQGERGVVRWNNELIPVDTIMCWDTAGTKASRKSDYHGLTVRGTDAYKNAWTVAAEGRKGTASEIVSRVVSMICIYRPRKLIIESPGSYDHWKDLLVERLQLHDVHVVIEEYKHGGVPKEERIAMLEPRWASRKWILKPDQVMLKEQIKDFSMDNKLSHDDVIDSFAMGEGQFRDPGDMKIFQEEDKTDYEYMRHLDAQKTRRVSWFGGARRR